MLKKALAQSEAGSLDPAALWADFQLRATRTVGPELHMITATVQRLPEEERAAVAAAIAALLAPVAWPDEWEVARPALLNGLDGLLHELRSSRADSFPRLLGLEADAELFAGGYIALEIARDFFAAPCRRDELRAAARCCSLGLSLCRRALRRGLDRRGAEPLASTLHEARARYLIAFQRYALAGRVLNDAIGAVVFEELDTPLYQERPDAG